MQSQFEQYLKNSDHFRDVINTHRVATAEVIGALMLFLVKQERISDVELRSLLRGLEDAVPGGRSINDERRLLVARIGDYMKAG